MTGAADRNADLRTPEVARKKPKSPIHKHLESAGAKGILKQLGPGLVTGASDDDPSGIATYSQVGARFGYGMLWTMLLSYPLMAAIQEICARIGRVTGGGLADNLRRYYPKWILYSVLSLMSLANIFNLGADLGAMGAATHLLLPGDARIYIVIFGIASVLAELFIPYTEYAKYLKWLTLSLFAYVGTAFYVHVPWSEVVHAVVVPKIEITREYLTALIAVLGTTISPYLFFWQASQEVEEVTNNPREEALREAPGQARSQLGRIRIDTYFGMAFSNVVAFFIILTTAATLHTHGIHEISSSAHRGDAAYPWNSRDLQFGPSRACVEAFGGPLRFPAVRMRHCGDGHARRSGAGWVGGIWDWGSSPLARGPGAQAERSRAILWRNCRRYAGGIIAESLWHRPDQGSFLGGSDEWLGGSAVDGRDHDHGQQPEGDGKVHDSPLSADDGMDSHRGDVVRLPRCICNLEVAKRYREEHDIVDVRRCAAQVEIVGKDTDLGCDRPRPSAPVYKNTPPGLRQDSNSDDTYCFLVDCRVMLEITPRCQSMACF